MNFYKLLELNYWKTSYDGVQFSCVFLNTMESL